MFPYISHGEKGMSHPFPRDFRKRHLRLRAVLAAARFCDTLAEEGLEGQSGVATGTVWCGPGLRPVRPQG